MSLLPQPDETSEAYKERVYAKSNDVGKKGAQQIAVKCARLVADMWMDPDCVPVFKDGKLDTTVGTKDDVHAAMTMLLEQLQKYETAGAATDFQRHYGRALQVTQLGRKRALIGDKRAAGEAASSEAAKEREFVAGFRGVIDEVRKLECVTDGDPLDTELKGIRKLCAEFLNPPEPGKRKRN